MPEANLVNIVKMKELNCSVILKLNEGDEKAANLIFNHFYPGLLHYVIKITGNYQEAEDISLRSFQKFFERSTLFDTDESIKAFLYIVARNESLNYLKARRRRWEAYNIFAMKADEFQQYNKPEIIIDERIAVNAAIEKLPSACLKIFQMLFIEEKKPAEIAAQLNLAESTIHNQKYRGLKILRQYLIE